MKTRAKIFSVFFLLTATLTIVAQRSYNDYDKTSKSLQYQEDFNNNSKNWSLRSEEEFIRTIQNGVLSLQSTVNRAKILFQPVEINENLDYEIETSIKFVTGKENTGHALLFGKSSGSDFGFYYTNQGSYKISKYDSEYKDYIDFTNSPFLKSNAYNKITLRKVGQNWYFFINEVLCHEMKSEPFFGNNIGFQVGGTSIIHVDYLYISYLEKQNRQSPNPSHVVSSISSPGAYNWLKASQLTPVFIEEFVNNDKSWGVGVTNDIKRSVEYGYYYFQAYIESFYSSFKEIDIDATRNFQIEAAIKYIGGMDIYENCLYWGGSNNASFRFGITGNGNYTAYKINSGNITDYVDYTPSSSVNKSGFNKLTVRKHSGNYYLFLNEILVHTMPFEPFFGQRVGFLVGKKSTIHIDYLKINYIN
jgi:hypothetical protein